MIVVDDKVAAFPVASPYPHLVISEKFYTKDVLLNTGAVEPLPNSHRTC